MESKRAMKKTIFKVTFYYFTITNISEKSITISAADSPIKSIMILQKVLVKSFNATIKTVKIIEVISRESIIEILKLHPKRDISNAKFQIFDRYNFNINKIKEKVLMVNKPLITQI
jgi:hypothetical protein